MNIDSAVSVLQVIFCIGLFFSITLIFERGNAKYKFMPSLCAYGLSAAFGMQALSIVREIVELGHSPSVSAYNTVIFGILLVLVVRARGNVSRIFEVTGKTN